MKSILLAGFIALGFCGAAVAKDVKLPDDNPVVTMTVPDDWSPRDAGEGIEATSPDGSTYIAFEVSDAKDITKLIEEAIKFLAKEGVTLDPATKKQSEGEINGMKGVNLEFDGKDKDGPTKIALTMLVPTAEKVVLVTFWGNAEGVAKNGAALGGIMKSVKPAS